ncbi:MAG: hypothetical protein KBG80_10440 [Breznakibacter sp.]|nr:hypothetical protein [Breznakibacter sp.]
MANRRDLKKDINFLTTEIVSECYIKHLLTNTDEKAVSELITEALSNGDEFLKRVNHPDGKLNPKLVKKYYSHLRRELIEKSNATLEKLGKL